MEDIEKQVIAYLERSYPVESPYPLTPEQQKSLSYKNEVFQDLMSEFPVSLGKETSRKERENRNFGPISDSTLTYGEIDFVSIGQVLLTIEERFNCMPKGGIFYDLGSGTGKGVVAAALLGDFSICRGIELLEGLFSISTAIKTKYDERTSQILAEHSGLFRTLPTVELYLNDFFQYDWSDAGLIFANSTCFDHDMMRKIGQVQLRNGTVGISFTKTIPGDNWIVLESIKKDMSWGEATVYIQRYVSTDLLLRISDELNSKKPKEGEAEAEEEGEGEEGGEKKRKEAVPAEADNTEEF